MSIRLRLTAIYSSILAFTLITFSIVLFILQSEFTVNMIENDLKRAALPIANRLPFALEDPSQMIPESETGQPRTQPWFDRIPLDDGAFRMRDFVNILDVEGNPVESPFTQEPTGYSISKQGLSMLQNGESWTEIISEEEERLLVYNQPAVGDDGSTVAIIQIVRSLAERDRSIQSLGIILVVGCVLTAMIAFGGGWFLAGTTLKPVTEMTQTAQTIGQERDFSARVLYDGPEDEIGHLAVTFNEMLSQLEEAYQKVTHSLQVQRDFVADVSHELRTPLTTIRGNLDLLKREPPVPQNERVDILDDLISESTRLNRLVNDLLILARADAGRKLQCNRVDVNSIVDDVVKQVNLLDPVCKITAIKGIDVYANANEDAFKQVLLIIMDNAIKYASCPITLHLAQQNNDIVIRIQDSGPGIPAEQLNRIFDRFYRGDASRSSPGFGLGLAIARTLLEAQDGKIEVHSEVDIGTIFTITLPKVTV